VKLFEVRLAKTVVLSLKATIPFYLQTGFELLGIIIIEVH